MTVTFHSLETSTTGFQLSYLAPLIDLVFSEPRLLPFLVCSYFFLFDVLFCFSPTVLSWLHKCLIFSHDHLTGWLSDTRSRRRSTICCKG
ncbi:hypothetical protein FA10DRAFT_128003 [Acaromyces ingoldii]|uniref:Uncharacterized protein n=1 Tax=Acaromyces ingoldii TaxID=215250 RepID=A0A316YPI9_9BASI|nr:hypothetical protein FA10DRAFT_128003 [Acaromyces ingoldii]PWN90946.1 hypothetical protein FA10DRAFT_128003 [Acaromyces ingoldii]